MPQQNGVIANVRCPRRLYGGWRYKDRAGLTLFLVYHGDHGPPPGIASWNGCSEKTGIHNYGWLSVTFVISLVASIHRYPSVDIHRPLASVRTSLSRVIVAESSITGDHNK